MGGHQANPAQAGQAFSGAQSAAAQNQQIGATASSNANALAANLFGTPTAGGGTTGGTLSAAANPASLNVTAPTGTFLQQYNNQNAGIANSFQQQRGALAQNLANRGFGSNSPSYFGASQAQQLGIGQAQAQNAAYTSATQAQQQQALANYQFANQMEANLYGQSLTGAVQGTQGAGSTYGNLYGTAGQYVNPFAQTLGAVGGILGGSAAGANAAANFLKP